MLEEIRAITSAQNADIQKIFVKYGAVTLTLGHINLLNGRFYPINLPERVSYEKFNGYTLSKEAEYALGFAIQGVASFSEL